MEENFNPVARTRANYYTPGSPVQFVCVELLKGDVSGEHAVCLTFKNISKVTLTALEIHFKCKGVDGVILCEDRFDARARAAAVRRAAFPVQGPPGRRAPCRSAWRQWRPRSRRERHPSPPWRGRPRASPW